jgi:superfamily II DNA or RNA helicase
VSPTLTPRKYQSECLESIFDGFMRGLKRIAVVLPTGTGKTVIFSHSAARVAREAVEMFRVIGNRVAVIVHRDALAKQAENKIHSIDTELTVGVVKAERHEIDADIVIISIQTLAPENQLRLRTIPPEHFAYIIVDECHHATADSYVRVLTYFGCFDDSRPVRMCGFTATLGRKGKGKLGDIFQEVVYQKDILWAIRNGFLVDPLCEIVTIDDLNMDEDLTKAGDDTTIKSVGNALLAADIGSICAEIADRPEYVNRQGMWFFPNVETTKVVCAALNAAGHPSEFLLGTTSDEERDLMRKRMDVGETQHLINCMVATEGFDWPNCSLVVNGRMTTNDMLWQQMIGRGLRLPEHPGIINSPYTWMRTPKTDCRIVDIVGVADKLSLASIADLTETQVVPEDGETLLEAVDREERAREKKAPKKRPDGELKTQSVELFGRSSSAWLQTRKGYWFLPTRDWYIVMWPETTAPDSLFRIGAIYKRSAKTVPGKKRPTGFELSKRPLTEGYGMAWCESAAEELSAEELKVKGSKNVILHRRAASWKKKKESPSPAQLDFAAGLHIVVPEGTTKAELSDLIDIIVASRQLDNYSPAEPSKEN